MSEASNPRRLYLKNVKVVFADLVDKGFGRSVTIDATEPAVTTAIEEWVARNNIGKPPNNGKAHFKRYGDVLQYSFKVNDSTKFIYNEGLSSDDLGYQAVVSLAANAFDYNNKFGKGTSSSLNVVVVNKGRATGVDEDIAELTGDTSVNQEPARQPVQGTLQGAPPF